MAAENGDFGLVLANLKFACFLPTCSEDPVGKDPMVGENGGGAAPGSDEAAGEEGAPVSRVFPRDVNSARVLKMSNINIEAWFKNLLSFDIMPLRSPACVAGHLSFREELVRRQAEKELAQAGSEFPSSSAQVVASCHGTEVMALLPQALPAGSSTTPILVEDKEKAADSMPPPPARKDVVLALRAPSAVLATQPKSRKRKLAKSGDGENSQRGGSSLASGLRRKFISLIDGMIGECGSETSRLSGELVELQGRWSETEAMLTAVKDSYSAKVSKLEVAIGELERDLGKTASSLLKEKKARKAKSSEIQARLAKISASLGSLECIRSRDLALAPIEGGMAVVRSFQSETPPTLEAKEARLSGCKGDMAAENGDFGLVLAYLKSVCFLLTCSEDPEGKDPMVEENGGGAAPGSDEAAGEEGA
ncbi:hypothetical protein F2Q69_00059636 [Brassica cretica]|uniref:Uncharacterized protein n=1 Tax=Brassica cretica TaxID=69181 RepID=A0A8S9RPA6_BRACR|nr:hypothetical protein F2Q69_00059636 [Brassica cretica]